MSLTTDTTTEDRIEPTIDVGGETVAALAQRLEAAGEEPSAEAVRDRALDTVEISPRFVAGGRPLAQAVRDELDERAE